MRKKRLRNLEVHFHQHYYQVNDDKKKKTSWLREVGVAIITALIGALINKLLG